MKEIKVYLRTMCKKIKSKKQRHAAYREISNHLQLQIEDFKESGLSESDAVHHVLNSATPAKVLGAKLNRAHSPWYIRHIVLVVTGILSTVSMVAFVASLVYVTHTKLVPALFANNKLSPEIAQLVEKDLRFLNKHPIGLESTRLKNAHSFLTKRFSSKNYNFDFKEEDMRVSDFMLKHRNWRFEKEALKELLDDSKLFEFETQWLEEILTFDHWNHFNKDDFNRKRNASSLRKIQAIASYSIPDNSSFVDWVMIYAFQQAVLNEPVKGLKIIRHAAKLVNSQRTLVGQSVATNILNYERHLAEFTNANWKSLSKEHVERYRRSSWAWAQIINLVSYRSLSIANRWSIYAKPSLGFCAGVVENPLGLTAIESFFSSHIPFEKNLSSAINKSKSLQKEMLHKCGLTEISPLLASSKSSIGDKHDAFSDGFASLWISRFIPSPLRLPYLRQYYALKMMTGFQPNFTGIYQRLLELQESKEESKSSAS